MQQEDSLIEVIGVLIRRRRTLLGVTGIAALLSIIISLILPVYYRASTTFLAASPDLVNPSKLFSGKEVEVYGSGNDIERLQGIAESEEVVGFLIDSFNLYEVYDIDPQSPRAYTDVREAFMGLYGVLRTRYDAVEISVEDKDPQRAAAMANAARNRTEAVIRATQQSGQREMRSTYEQALTRKLARQQSLADTLRVAGARYKIVDVAAQSESLSSALSSLEQSIVADSAALAQLKTMTLSAKLRDTLTVLNARLQGAKSARQQLLKDVETFAEGRSLIQSLNSEYAIVTDQIAYDQERVRQLETLLSAPGPVLYVSDYARIPDRKMRPVRWLIVVGGTVLAFVLTALFLIVQTTYGHIDWRGYWRSPDRSA